MVDNSGHGVVPSHPDLIPTGTDTCVSNGWRTSWNADPSIMNQDGRDGFARAISDSCKSSDPVGMTTPS